MEYSDEYFILTLIPIDTVHTIIQIPQAIVHIEEDTNDGNELICTCHIPMHFFLSLQL